MKKFLITLLMILSTASSFAACFVTSNDAAAVKASLPSSFCVDSHTISLIVPELPAKPFYRAVVETDFGTITQDNVSFKPQGEQFIVKARKTFKNEGGACERSRNIYIEFTMNVNATLDVYDIQATGFDVTNPDSCHSSDRVTKIEYSAI